MKARAYVVPMAIFFLLTWAGRDSPHAALIYACKTFIVGGSLWAFRREFAPLSWRAWPIGVAVGLVGAAQWIGMEWAWTHCGVSWAHRSTAPFDPNDSILPWLTIIVRIVGAAAVVPFLEELFWRDFVWRALASPSDFTKAEIGARDPVAFAIVTIAFAAGHPEWLTALVWSAFVGALLWRTRSLGACIAAHAATNAALAAYVLTTQSWWLW